MASHMVIGGANLRTSIEAIMKHQAVMKLNLMKTLALTVAGTAALAVPVFIGILNAPRLLAQAPPTSAASSSAAQL